MFLVTLFVIFKTENDPPVHKKVMIHSYNETLLFNNNNECIIDTCNNKDESQYP